MNTKESVKEQINELQAKKDSLTEKYLDGDFDKETFKRLLSKYDAQMNELKEQVASLEPSRHNKKAGVKTGNYAVSIDDVKLITKYMIDHNMMINLLHVILQFNTGRRVSDILNLKWSDLLNDNGSFRRDIKVFKEKKTSKEVQVHITEPVKWVINKYCNSIGLTTSEAVKLSGDESFLFYQWQGTHKGCVVSQKALNEAVKKVAVGVGIKENVTTHSLRRGFGAMIRELHADDPNCMMILQGIFNHSSQEMTAKYIGLTKENEDNYYDSLGNMFKDVVIEGGDQSHSCFTRYDQNNHCFASYENYTNGCRPQLLN